MESIWRMFRDNNYVMSKLFEEESVFPVILGSCGPYYAAEHLKAIHPSAGIRQYMYVATMVKNIFWIRSNIFCF